MNIINLQGQVFRDWTVLRRTESRKGQTMWLCRCLCGVEKPVSAVHLLHRGDKGCRACYRKRYVPHNRGLGADYRSEWGCWYAMKYRCTNPKSAQYELYRGVRISDEMSTFQGFLEVLGPRPARTTVHRIDPNGHYERGNVKWATVQEQNDNKRTTHKITAVGQTLNSTQWGKALGVNPKTVLLWAKRGILEERASSILRLC